jgi:hypothetical protein
MLTLPPCDCDCAFDTACDAAKAFASDADRELPAYAGNESPIAIAEIATILIMVSILSRW